MHAHRWSGGGGGESSHAGLNGSHVGVVGGHIRVERRHVRDMTCCGQKSTPK